MFEDNEENIPSGRVEYSLISLFSKKLRIGVIGAGKAGFIKTRRFFKQGCQIEVLAEDCDDIFSLLKGDNIKIYNKSYEKDFIKDKHLIIIAIDNEEKRNEIKNDCEEEFKIYIDSTSFIEGMGSVPVQRELNNIIIGINTRDGNPKGAVFLGNKAKEELKKYDEYIKFTTLARNFVKDKHYKKEFIDFISTEDFLYIFEKGYGKEVLEMFFTL